MWTIEGADQVPPPSLERLKRMFVVHFAGHPLAGQSRAEAASVHAVYT